MSRWSLAIKKLSPAKKAWKSFITKVQPKLQTLLKTSLPKAIRATTQRLLNSLRSFIPSRLRPVSAARRKSYYNYSRQFYYHNRNRNTPLYKSFAAIHIDELFEPVAAADSASSTATTTKNRNILRDNMHTEAGTSGGDDIIKKGKRVVEGDNERSLQKSKSIYSVEDAWNAVVAASPQLRCVDERAEEFIYKVRQDMRLQKENSFEEMLARSS